MYSESLKFDGGGGENCWCLYCCESDIVLDVGYKSPTFVLCVVMSVSSNWCVSSKCRGAVLGLE